LDCVITDTFHLDTLLVCVLETIMIYFIATYFYRDIFDEIKMYHKIYHERRSDFSFILKIIAQELKHKFTIKYKPFSFLLSGYPFDLLKQPKIIISKPIITIINENSNNFPKNHNNFPHIELN
jgi:hypothetical protein